MPDSKPSHDARLAGLAAWIGQCLSGTGFELTPASADASFRRYFRARLAAPWSGHASVIAMDAPPARENCRPYIEIAALLRKAGVHAPEVLAADLEQGYLLISDLGDETYLSALQPATAHALYLDALDALVLWQRATDASLLPAYDVALLGRELALFPDWYVGRHLGVTLTREEHAILGEVSGRVLANNVAQPAVFVHRDFHSRNLMVASPNPGVLDFQDAVVGPITYDLVSLLRDAYIAWDEEVQIDLAVRYWERARKAALPVGDDFGLFWRDFEWMGVQRQLKVLGIFARLAHRDGKHGYVDDMPRVLAYLRGACRRYGALTPLLQLLDRLEGRTPTVGMAS